MPEKQSDLTEARFIRLARDISSKSNCSRRQVGAVIVKDGSLIAEGWNGVNSFANCLAALCPRCERGQNVGTGYDECICIHAEQSAIASAARRGTAIDGAIMFLNLRPCFACLNLAIEAGITSIVYSENWSYAFAIEDLYLRATRQLALFKWIKEDAGTHLQTASS